MLATSMLWCCTWHHHQGQPHPALEVACRATPEQSSSTCWVGPADSSALYNSGQFLPLPRVGPELRRDPGQGPIFLLTGGKYGKNESHRKTSQAPVTFGSKRIYLCFFVFSPFLSFVANENRTQQNPTTQQNFKRVALASYSKRSAGTGAPGARTGESWARQACRGQSAGLSTLSPASPKSIRLKKKDFTNKTKHNLS